MYEIHLNHAVNCIEKIQTIFFQEQVNISNAKLEEKLCTIMTYPCVVVCQNLEDCVPLSYIFIYLFQLYLYVGILSSLMSWTNVKNRPGTISLSCVCTKLRIVLCFFTLRKRSLLFFFLTEEKRSLMSSAHTTLVHNLFI